MTGSLTLSACALIPPPVQRRTPGQVRLTRAVRMATTGERDNGPLSLPTATAVVALARRRRVHPIVVALQGSSGECFHTIQQNGRSCAARTACRPTDR